MVVGQLDQIDDRGSHEPVDIATKIEKLENQFDDLQTRIINELTTEPGVTTKELLNKLTQLPLSLRKDYESSITKRIEFHGMRTETPINDLFIIHLNPLISFLDYGLIEYVIKKFGSDDLQKDMRSYCSEMIVFMKETTIKQLINHLPGQPEIPPKFSLIEAKISRNASECTLEELNTIRKRFCSEVKLSEIVFHLVAVVESNSFIVRWLVPSALVDDVVRSTKNLNQSFYQDYKIIFFTLNGMWLFIHKTETDAMWSRQHVSDVKFKDQFHTMYKQVVYELGLAQIAWQELSSYFKRSLKCHQSTSDSLSHELLNHKLPVSVVDFRVLAAAIEGFGSNCLKSVMSSYSKYMSTFLKKSTAQQLITLLAIQFQPSGYSIVKYTIKKKPSQYKLDELFSFRTRFCTIADFSEFCFVTDEVNTEMSDSFTVSWLVPPAFVSDIMCSTRNVDESFYQKYDITSLILDGMWLYVNKSEIDIMWSQAHVSNTKFIDQFRTMCKQIVCEIKLQNVSEDRLSLYFQSLNFKEQISDQLSLAILEEEFPASFVDFGILKAVIETFGSHCLKRVITSYCNYMSIFIKESTAQQLVNIGSMSTVQPTDFKVARCRMMEESSNYNLEKLFMFRIKFCKIINLRKLCFIMDKVNTETSGSFTVSWLVPPAFISDMMKFTRNVDHSLYHRFNITSLTLDGLWLFLSEIEIDTMWLHVSNTKFKDQFCTMCKQIVCEIKVQNVSKDRLSLYFQSLDYQQQISNQLSLEILNYELPASFVDFRVLNAVIKGFGSDCLKRVMESYCNYMSIFTKKSTVQQLINLSALQSKHFKQFVVAKCTIMEEPSHCRLEKLLQFRTRFCAITRFNEVCFIMDRVNMEIRGSFTVSWLVPSTLVSEIIAKAARYVDQSFYHEFKITSLTLDGMWLYMSETEIDAMWLKMRVGDTKLNDQFYIIHKQVFCEIDGIGRSTATDKLSSYLMDQQPTLQQDANVNISKAFLNSNFPISVIDFRMLTIVIELFGSDCLKRVMESYYRFISTFLKQLTLEQLIDLPPIQSRVSEDFLAAECKIKGEPFEIGLEKLLEFQTKFCSMVNIDKVCFVMGEVQKKMNDSLTVSWHIPSASVSYIVKFTRNIFLSFYQEYEIASLTLDGMWIFLSDAEIGVLWHLSDFESQFLTMYRQIVYELKVQDISENKLSTYLTEQQPKLQSNASIQLSEAFLKHDLPLHFRLQSTVIEKFGSDCIKNVMKSFHNYVYTRESTVEQLVSLPPIPSQTSKYFVSVESRNREDPSDCRLARLFDFQSRFCSITNIDEVCFIMDKIEAGKGGSFGVRWHVPSSLALDLLKSANQFDLKQIELFQEMNIPSLQLGGMWLYNYQLTTLGIKLRKRYQQSQGSPSPVEWIPSPTKKIFRLAMIQRERVQQGHIEDRFVRMTISGRVDDILHAKSPVELEHIFRNTLHGGEIILIEGAPGSGKSTLTVHICQRWGKGEFFQQFTVVILIQLRDPAVQRAQTVADLLPVENAEEIATELIATNGRGVLWVLDGWDELPPHLQQQSIFCQFIKRMLSECSVIVTSRPISSGDLQPVVSSRIEVLGFTPEEQRQYFSECLKGDTKALEALLEKIQENPVVQSICYLPLNAAFIVHTFKYRDQSLPNTEYEIYLSVILSCIQRHYDREGRGHDLPRELASFDDLSRSEAVREPFQCLCELAYCGVMKNKVTFSSSDLPQGSNTLSLLQAIESFLQSGKSVFYNFLHLSIQEVLSAYYIATKLSDSEQVSQFQQLFNQPRFAAVFQFYAAITKLKSSGIRQVIDRIVEAKSKPLLVSLLHCLHEAQDPALCLYVAEGLEYRLDLSETSLSPLDCLSVSLFLSSVSCKETSVNLAQCQIGDFGAKCLIKYLSMSSHTDLVTINLKGSDIDDEGAAYIARLLHFTEYLHLDISETPIGYTGASFILEALRTTTTLKSFTLVGYAIFSTRTEDILIALGQNNSLKKIDVFWSISVGKEITQPSFQLIASVDKDAKMYAFTNLDIVTKDATKLSMNLASCLSASEELNSFIITWRIPSVSISYLIESVNRIGQGYFEMKHILSLSVGNRWLYNPKLSKFGSTLKQRYQQSQGLLSPVEWTPSPIKEIFRLAMIQRERVQRGYIEDRFVRMTVSGRVDDILHAKFPVKVEDIFRNTLHGGEIILIEGAPGSGKSTLTVHICQRWGKGELLEQFTVVILVQLRDPAVQRAQTIADLLPIENAEEIATELIATNGRGILLVLDGWDELLPHLQQDSIFRKLLPPKRSKPNLAKIEKDPVSRTQFYKDRLLNEASIIVTSRPILSGDLHPVVSSRIEVLGFTPEEQRQYFTECLKEDTNTLEVLLEKIQENPAVESICYLPLNAAFIVHTSKYRGQSLPNTEYEIYLSVILSCIQRHFDRESGDHDLPRELASLNDLSRSEALREPFQCLCELAYRGVMENKVTFSSSDLPQGSNTLSLLQAIESFLQSGKSVFYNFLHLSVQEVLSAYYIATKLSDSEQVSQFQQLFNQPRFAAVFNFYAAITKLKSPGIRQVIDRIVEAKSKPLLVSLLPCLHEAQDPALCLYVAERLGYSLDLSGTSLSPLDCLSVSFFLSSLCGKEISINLAQCQIGDFGVKYLIKYLSVSSYTDLVTINLKDNAIHDEGASYVAIILHFIESLHLDISGNPIGVTGTSYLFQAVRKSAILKTLVLIGGTIIADLLPVENAQETATELRATSDCAILWILDDLYSHVYAMFLSPKHNSECSIIVTTRHIIDKIIKDRSKPLLVSLLRCLHEAQDPALCLYVAERLEYELDLSDTSLSPLDCLSVSFFLSSLTGKETSVVLCRCTIGDLGAKYLSEYQQADSKTTIDLTHNEIHEGGALHIARILYFIEHLYLSSNPIGDNGASLISKAVRETTTLKTLFLHKCSITSIGTEDLSRALAQNSSLEKFNIRQNTLGDVGINHVAEALKQNKQLKELWIGDCGMTDEGAASLARALTVNNSLKMLHIGGPKGALTEDGLSIIARSLASKSKFVKLAIPAIIGTITAYRLSQEVNEARKRNGLPPIKIEDVY